MATAQFSFTERDLDKWVKRTLVELEIDSTAGEAWAQDRGGPGSIPGLHVRLRLRTQNGARTLQDPNIDFYLMKKVRGRKVNRHLGDRAVTGVAAARIAAKDLLKALEQGEDPKEDRRRADEVRKLKALTYKQALEGFLDKAEVTEGTRRKYRGSLTTTFKDVANEPLANLTPQRVRSIHKARSAESKSRADQDMRVLRLVWNWASAEMQTNDGESVLGKNPVGVLNKRERGPGQRGWNNVPRKESIIPRARLPEWFTALRQIHDKDDSSDTRRVSCLLLECLCLTGLRFSELAGATWEQVDLGMGTLTIPDTSSKNRRALVRPLTRRVLEILSKIGTDTGFIFPGRVLPDNTEQHPVNNTRKLQLEIQRRTGLWITPHDLRRVYASAASRAGLPEVVIKRLLNHTGHTEEVTQGYIRLGLDELLEHSQAVEDTILGDAGLLASRNLDARLQDVLAALPEDEKRRLLFELAERQTRGAA